MGDVVLGDDNRQEPARPLRFRQREALPSDEEERAHDNSQIEHASCVRNESKSPDTGSMVGTIANIVKNVIGSGLLNIPESLFRAGYPAALCVLVTMGVLNGWTFYLLGRLSQGRDKAYGDTWARILGNKTAWVVELFIVLNGMLTSASYMVIVAQQVPPAMGSVFPKSDVQNFGPKQLAAVLPLAWGVVFPLCLLRSLTALKVPSLIGIAGATFAFVFIIFDWARHGCIEKVPVLNNGEVASWVGNRCFGAVTPFDAWRFLDIMAIFSSSYACHYNAPKLFNELKDRTLHKWRAVCAISFTIIIVFFAVFAAAGYGRFGQAIDGNILNSYDGKLHKVPEDQQAGLWLNASWLGMVVCSVTNFPLVFSAPRASFTRLLFRRPVDEMGSGYIVVFALLWVGCAAAVGLWSPPLAAVNKVKGFTTTIGICVLFPGLMAWSAAQPGAAEHEDEVEQRGLLSDAAADEQDSPWEDAEEEHRDGCVKLGPSGQGHPGRLGGQRWLAVSGVATAAVGCALALVGLAAFVQGTLLSASGT